MGLSVAKPTCVTRPCCGVMADVHYWADSGAGDVVLQHCVSSNISFVSLTYVQGVSQQPVRSQRDKSCQKIKEETEGEIAVLGRLAFYEKAAQKVPPQQFKLFHIFISILHHFSITCVDFNDRFGQILS